MLHAADVLGYRHPAAHIRGIERALLVTRRAVAEEVPRRVDEGIHGVGIALRRPAALRAVHVDPAGRRSQRRGSLGDEIGARQVWQLNRQLIIGHRHLPTPLAVDDRYRASPIALPAQQPVPQPEGDRTFADTVGFPLFEDLADAGLFAGQAVQWIGVDVGAVAGRRDTRGDWIRSASVDHFAYGQAEGQSEVQVTLIMGRHRHDRSRTVLSYDFAGAV